MEAAIAKYLLVFYNCGDFIVGGLQTFSKYFNLRPPLWVLIFFVCTCSTGAYFNYYFYWMCFLLLPYQPLLRRSLINAGPFYAGPNSATPKIWFNATYSRNFRHPLLRKEKHLDDIFSLLFSLLFFLYHTYQLITITLFSSPSDSTSK